MKDKKRNKEKEKNVSKYKVINECEGEFVNSYNKFLNGFLLPNILKILKGEIK